MIKFFNFIISIVQGIVSFLSTVFKAIVVFFDTILSIPKILASFVGMFGPLGTILGILIVFVLVAVILNIVFQLL